MVKVYVSVDMEGVAGVSHGKPTSRGDDLYPMGTAAVGQRMATAMFVDGDTKLVFILLQRMAGAEVFEMAVQK